jgi:hypothetical protein
MEALLTSVLGTYLLISVVMCVGFVVGAWWAGRSD